MKKSEELLKAELAIRLMVGSHPDEAAGKLLAELASDVAGHFLGEIPFHLASLRYAHKQMSIVNVPERQRLANRIAARHNSLRQFRTMLRQLRNDLNRPTFQMINDARLTILADEISEYAAAGDDEKIPVPAACE
jgi:hypothetical protein